MKVAILLASLLLGMANAMPADPCKHHQMLQEHCSSCTIHKTCTAEDRVTCAQLHNYGKQCYFYKKSIDATKHKGTNTPQKKNNNKPNTPSVTLQDSFDTSTPETLQNKLHLYKNDIRTSKQMPEVVAPKPKMPEETPQKAPSVTDNILKSWY